MDDERFDAVARTLGAGSRRSVLRLLAGGVLGLLLGGPNGTDAKSARTRRRDERPRDDCRRTQRSCRADKHCCSDQCKGRRCTCREIGERTSRCRGGKSLACCSGSCRNRRCCLSDGRPCPVTCPPNGACPGCCGELCTDGRCAEGPPICPHGTGTVCCPAGADSCGGPLVPCGTGCKCVQNLADSSVCVDQSLFSCAECDGAADCHDLGGPFVDAVCVRCSQCTSTEGTACAVPCPG